MRMYVDAWDPSYGSSVESDRGPAGQSKSKLDTDVELPTADWRPVGPPDGLAAPDRVLLVDGVRRIDARLWVEEDDGAMHPGVAASYAAGVVCCELNRGAAEVAGARVVRGLFTPSGTVADVRAGTTCYRAIRVNATDPMQIPAYIQPHLTELEVEISGEARAGGHDLLVVDGPLRTRTHLANTLGYVKSHRVEYLPAALSTVVRAMKAGERCPVFLIGEGTAGPRHTWYLRLPGTFGNPWAGVVRVEAAADLPRDEVVRLADLSTVTLPKFASTAYKDPRAPQNLIPIAGLEKRLRAMLGDPRLLHRALVTEAARAALSGVA